MIAGLPFFDLELVIKTIGEQGDQVIHVRLVDEDGNRHVHSVRLVSHFDLLLFEKVQELIMLGITDRNVDGRLDNPLDQTSLVNSVSGDVAVCPNEATRPKLDPTEVPGDHGDHVMKLG